MNRILTVMLLSLLVLFSGCSSVLPKPDPPKVSLAGLKIAKLNWSEQTFDLTLNIQNPNNFSLPLRGLDYALKLNGNEFARGLSNDNVTIAANGEAQIKLRVGSNLLKSISQISSFLNSGGSELNYSLDGNFGVLHESFRLPFNRSGKVNLLPK